jgi:hypothetical protein
MADFSGMVDVTKSSWGTAQDALNAIRGMSEADKKDPTKFAELLLTAQTQIGVATSMEQKASAAIDKAYQAHGQVASK